MTKGRRQSKHPKSLLSLLLVRENGRCYYCTCQLALGDGAKIADTRATIDHKIPVMRGGEAYGDNVVLACAICNKTKGPLTDAEFNAARHDRKARKAAVRKAHELLEAQSPEERAAILQAFEEGKDDSYRRLRESLQPAVDQLRAGYRVNADMAELADAPDLKSGALARAGSSPAVGTTDLSEG